MATITEIDIEKDVEGYRGGFDVFPPGWYPVRIIGEEVKPTSSGSGRLLIFTYEIIGKDGKTLKDKRGLNIINPNEQAQAIARATLAKIAECVGKRGRFSDTNILFGLPFEVELEIVEFESNKEPGKMLKSNKIKGYRPMQKAKAPGAAPGIPVAPTNKPW